MKPLPLALLILVSAPPHLHSQTPQQATDTAFQAQAGFRLQILPSGEKILGWTGRTGFTYFIQASPDLVDWTWAPNIEPGVNGPMSYQIGGPTARGFFRLTGTSQTAAAPDTADFDGDGLSNLSEITPRPRPGNLTGFAGLKPNIQTSPVDGDTDHDGLGDKWEQDNNLDPTDDGTRDIQNGPDGDPDTDGFSNLREQTDHTNPRGNATTTDSDGDGIQDIDDAVPGDRLIDWKKTPESSYILIDVEVPAEADSAQDLNDKGEILFDHGIWSGGDWISRQAQDGSGTVPVTNGAEYDIHYGANWFFNDSRHLLGVAGLTFTTTAAAGGSGIACPTFWPTVQSSPSLIYDTANMWDNFAWSFWPMGVSKNGDMAIRITRLRGPSPGTAPTQTIDRFDSSGARTGGMDGTGGYHPSGGWQHGDTTSSGWVASNLARESTEAQPTAAYKVGLWNDSNTLKTLPAEAEGWGYPIRVSDVPNSKIALVAGQWSGSVHKGRVFLSDANGDMKYSSSLSDQKIQLFAGDGTALTSEDKLWRNGKLIPLRKLCKEYGQLLDDGFHIFPLKSNKHGMYLIQAQNESGQTVTKLLASVRFNLRNSDNYAKGWDNTDFEKGDPDSSSQKGPWTSCGVNRKKADGTDWPNSLIGLVIPGCTEKLANLLELVEYIPSGGDSHVTLTHQEIKGEVTHFDIQGTRATAGGCNIIVREKAHQTHRSGPLHVHVFPPRVVKFQVYRASPTAGPEPGFAPTVAQIKTELNNTYNEQANIRFEELQPDMVSVNNITGVFSADGNLTVPNRQLLIDRIDERNPEKHLKIILIKSLTEGAVNAPDIVGVADFQEDWVIVEASVSQLDTYSHETGHSFNLASKGDGKHHEVIGTKAPNGQDPLMHPSNGSTRWIRQEDWKLSNTEADNIRYGR